VEAAAHRHGELVPLADAANIRAREHERSPRMSVGDGVDAADLRALLVGGDEVFLVLGFHVRLLRVRRGDFFAEIAPTWVLYISGGGGGVYGSWSGERVNFIEEYIFATRIPEAK